MSRSLTYVTIPVLAMLVGGTIQVVRPLPPIQVRATPHQVVLPGKLSVAFPAEGQFAVGEESLGVAAETPNQQPVAIASLTKMMTAYLLLKAHPLKVGEDGPITTITPADVQVYQSDKANGDSVARVSAGDKLTERQLLEALLLPSADNIATLIANQVASSEANFVQKMNQAAHSLGMTQTTYTDAAGVDATTVSTAHDQILMAQAAMQDRTFREVVRMPQANLPTAGRVFNVDFMVGKQGMSGVKTGSTRAAGSCFVGSYPVTINGTPRLLLGAILGQPSLRVALTTDTTLLHAVAPQFKDYPVDTPADGFARLTTPWNPDVRLKLATPLSVFGYPGMPVKLTAKLTQEKLPINAGDEVAHLSVASGDSSKTLKLVSEQSIQAPGMLWRLHR